MCHKTKSHKLMTVCHMVKYVVGRSLLFRSVLDQTNVSWLKV
jgi:hypothetical protein